MSDSAKTLAAENLGLVHLCANKFKGRGIDYEDLYSAGCVGLVRAANNFDETLGFAFSTYAVPSILGEIKRCFRDGGEIRVGRALKERARDLLKEKERIEAETGREVGVSELALALGLTASEVAELLNVTMPVISIDSRGPENGTVEIPESSFEGDTIDKLTVKSLLEKLTFKDRRLIEMRYFSGMTQSEVALELEMTQVQVSRREKVLLLSMRNDLKFAIN